VVTFLLQVDLLGVRAEGGVVSLSYQTVFVL
jgi:hypothetical protein